MDLSAKIKRRLKREAKREEKEIALSQVIDDLFLPVEYGSGVIWKTGRGRVKKGDIFGSLNEGYWFGEVTINGKKYRYSVHRVKYYLIRRVWPEIIDHINGNPSDNRIDNLRSCTQRQNLQNAKRPCNNTSGHKGIQWIERLGKWETRFTANYKYYSVGYFESLEDAVEALRKKREEVCGEYTKHN